MELLADVEDGAYKRLMMILRKRLQNWMDLMLTSELQILLYIIIIYNHFACPPELLDSTTVT